MAKTTTWTGATDLSSYFTATNWSNGVPGAGDTEVIPTRLPKATGLNLVGQTVNLTQPANSANTLFTIISTAAAPSSLDAATVVNGGDNLVELDGNVVNNGTIFDTDLSLVDATGGTGVPANASVFTNNGTITYNVAPPTDPGYLILGSTTTGLLNNGTVNVASPAGAIATGLPADPFPVQLDVFGPVTGSGTFNVTGGFPNGAKPPPNSTQPHKGTLVLHGLVSTTGVINLNDASVRFLQYKNSATVNFQDASSAVYVTDASQNQSGVTITGFRAGDVVGLNTTKITQAVYDSTNKVVDLEEANGQVDSTLNIVAGLGQVLSTASFAISKSYGTDTGENFLTTTLAAPTPPPPGATTVPALVAADLPAASYSARAMAAAAAGLSALPGAGIVLPAMSAGGPFAAATAGVLNVAVATAPAAGAALALPAGYGGLIAQGGGAVTLSDAGAAGAVLVGDTGATTFNSTGAGVTLVGGQGANTFNVSGSATVVTGDGASTVKGTGNAALSVTTGSGASGSTVVLAGGASTVQSNGQDTVFGGMGASTVTAAKGLVAVGGAGLMTFIGGSATSLVFGGMGGVSYTAGSAFDIVVGVGGPLKAQGGSGGGQFFGNGGGDVIRAGSGQAVMVGSNGDQLFSSGSAGDFLVAGAGAVTLDGSGASGADAFFGGTGQDTFVLGSGNDLVGTGTGTSTVQLGSGMDTVFAFGTSAVTSGSGSANVVMGGAVQLNIASGAARDFALFNFVPGTDRISLQGYGSGTVANALATQVNGGGQTVLTLSDNTVVQLIGVARADASFFS